MLQLDLYFKNELHDGYRTRVRLAIEEDDEARDFIVKFRKFCSEYELSRKPYVITKTVAAILEVSPATVCKWCKLGMPYHDDDGRNINSGCRSRKYLWDEILPWIKKNRPYYISVYEKWLKSRKEEYGGIFD